MFKLFVILFVLAGGEETVLEKQPVDKGGTVQVFNSKPECEAYAKNDKDFLVGYKVVEVMAAQNNKHLGPGPKMQVRWECDNSSNKQGDDEDDL